MEYKYGGKPQDLGLVDLSPTEMMFWLYCPIKVPGGEMTIPANLTQFYTLIRRAVDDLPREVYCESYVYITAKTLFVTPENRGNRLGWHSDGFMTEDINYIWSDTKGTLFWEPLELCGFTQDHEKSMREMEVMAEFDQDHHRVYPDKHLLRLDESVIHRVADFSKPGMRTFVKISISKHQYRLKGNSINHGLDLMWEYENRSESRNAPEVLIK